MALAIVLAACAPRANLEKPASAVIADPLPDAAHPPRLDSVQIPSGNVAMNGVLYVAAGAGPHPTVLLLHGFPGNEQNLDLAQAIRRAGWNVLTLHYRGSWGSPGAFSFANTLDDARAALAFLRDPAVAKVYGIDPNAIVVIGHSLGGLLAAAVGKDPTLAGVGLLAAWNLGREGAEWQKMPANQRAKNLVENRDAILPLAGCTLENLFDEAGRDASSWNLPDFAPGLRTHPVLVISADDGGAADSDALVTSIRAASHRNVTSIHLATDHAFSGRRIAVASEVVNWLGSLDRHR